MAAVWLLEEVQSNAYCIQAMKLYKFMGAFATRHFKRRANVITWSIDLVSRRHNSWEKKSLEQ